MVFWKAPAGAALKGDAGARFRGLFTWGLDSDRRGNRLRGGRILEQAFVLIAESARTLRTTPVSPCMPVFTSVICLLALAAELADTDLARRIRSGDAGAFREFFDRYHGPVLAYLARRGLTEEEADDVAQAAFVALWERRDGIDEGRSLRGYLFRAAHNRALNHFRDHSRFVSDADAEPVAAETPLDAAEHAEIFAALEAAVASLPERRRATFELCFMQQLSQREAAEILGITVKTVENQMRHALRHIRERLQPFLNREPAREISGRNEGSGLTGV
jgi:RNA polymerase sigma-70 factor, ECF subfamily